MNAFISKCIEANLEISCYISKKLKPNDFLYQKTCGEGGDIALNIDLIAESIFIKYLSSFGNIYSEESGYINSKNINQQNITIIIDPIDGSDNFISNLPYYGTSVAMKIDNNVKIAVVCNLINGLIYIRDENEKLYLCNLEGKIVDDNLYNEVKPKVGIFERSYSYPNVTEVLSINKLKYRSPGAVALSIAWARYYNFVLFCGKQREFDLAAALYISKDLKIYQKDDLIIVSKNEEIFNLLKKLLKNIRL